MGRHSMDHQAMDDQPESLTSSPLITSPEDSIAPPGEPIDPGVPGAPDVPGFPGPDAPSTVPVEPPPLAPENPDDGSVSAPGTWHAAGTDLL